MYGLAAKPSMLGDPDDGGVGAGLRASLKVRQEQLNQQCLSHGD
jgi:hypothetical protein